jgi:DNA-binding MarR family transcriptional regulator
MLQKVAESSTSLVPKDPLIADFGLLAAAIGRLSAAISSLPVFKLSGVTACEWVALLMLDQRDRTSNNQLAKQLGVSRQRAHQILAGFVANGLVTMEVSPADSRRNEIFLTAVGREKLNQINEGLDQSLAASLGRKSRLVPRIRTHIVRMTKAIERSKLETPAAPVKEKND